MLVSNVLWLILQSQVEIKLPVGWRISKWSHKTPYWLNDTHGMFQETTTLLHIQKRKWVVNTEYKTHSILPLIIPRHFHTTHSLPCSRFLVCHETLRDIPKNRCEGDYTVHSAPCLPSKLCMRIVLGDTKFIMSNMKAVNTEVSNGHLT